MEISHSEYKFSFHIEPKPEGGFIARPSDPSAQPIEGATREEVEEKVRTKITQIVGAQLPGFTAMLNIGGADVKIGTQLNFNVTRRNQVRVQAGDLQGLKTRGPLTFRQSAMPAGPAAPASSMDSFAGPIERTGDAWGLPALAKAMLAVLAILVLFLLSRR
jgi:hypothetical protein